jgi:hypothetical protein
MFCAPRLFRALPRVLGLVFKFCATGHVFGGTEGVGTRFQVLRSRTRFWRYRGRRVPFLCFALQDSFWALPRAPGPVFIFCAPGLISGSTEGVGSRFQVLRSRIHFRRYRGRRGSFSCFAVPDSFWAVSMPSGHVFKFYSPGHVSGGTKGFGSHFQVLSSRTRFWRNRGR